MTTPPSRGRRKEEVGEVVHVGGLKVKEVEEGRSIFLIQISVCLQEFSEYIYRLLELLRCV